MKKTNYISRTVYHVLMVLPLLALTLLTACSEDELPMSSSSSMAFLDSSMIPSAHNSVWMSSEMNTPSTRR